MPSREQWARQKARRLAREEEARRQREAELHDYSDLSKAVDEDATSEIAGALLVELARRAAHAGNYQAVEVLAGVQRGERDWRDFR